MDASFSASPHGFPSCAEGAVHTWFLRRHQLATVSGRWKGRPPHQLTTRHSTRDATQPPACAAGALRPSSARKGSVHAFQTEKRIVRVKSTASASNSTATKVVSALVPQAPPKSRSTYVVAPSVRLTVAPRGHTSGCEPSGIPGIPRRCARARRSSWESWRPSQPNPLMLFVFLSLFPLSGNLCLCVRA